jgi:AraC-like DNA-binding protein
LARQRASLAKKASDVGWLSGLRDDGHALSAIHAEPSRNWKVEALAEMAAMSRSAFAARLLAAVGQTPL